MEKNLIYLNKGEMKFMEWQLHMSGSFFKALVEAMMRADDDNRQKLALGYPELMQAVVDYQNKDGYWQDLQNRYAEEVRQLIKKQ